jgi:hypothetical protein
MTIKIKFVQVAGLIFSALTALTPSAASAAPRNGKYFDRSIMVIFENTNYSDVIRQPFFKSLATDGANLTNFIAETHPSQANYIALTSGTLAGVKGDGNYDLNITNVVDLLEAHGVSWKVYVESWPGHCSKVGSSRGYARKHNPFISYTNISGNPARCAHIVDASEFDKDVASNTLPSYVFYVPDLNNDGHDTGVAYADRWYKDKFGPLLTNQALMENTVLISTFDESGKSKKNLIYTSIAGPGVKAGAYADEVNHFSLLRLIEDNWSLGTLGRNDDMAPVVPQIWK